MWFYQIIGEYGECLESGAFADKEELRLYCEKRMIKLNAFNWFAEFIQEV